MKFAFTTLGCPGWDLRKIVSNAKSLGYDGIDFRGYLSEVELFRTAEFTTSINETKKLIRENGLEVPALSSSVRVLCKTENDRLKHIDDLKKYVEMAEKLDCPYVRIFGGHFENRSYEEALKLATENIGKMLQCLSGSRVRILVETHDDWICSSRLRDLLENLASECVFALWDVHHPYRMMGESPEKTWSNIGKFVRYTHFKDSVKTDDNRGYKYAMPGKGDIPIGEILKCLKKGGYNAYLTLEWEKRWHKDIEEPELVFPYYIREMKRLLNAL